MQLSVKERVLRSLDRGVIDEDEARNRLVEHYMERGLGVTEAAEQARRDLEAGSETQPGLGAQGV